MSVGNKRFEVTSYAKRGEYGAKGKTWLSKDDFNPVDISFYKDGAVGFSRAYGEHFIYLYPSQVGKLKALLVKDLSPRRKTK